MNFREEYIKAVEEITPDRQAIDRMKENVLRITREKRAFPFKTVAVIGGTAAACAVITVAAVRISPILNASDNALIEFSNTAGAPESGAISYVSEAEDAVNADSPANSKEYYGFVGSTLEMWDNEEAFPEDEPNDMLPSTTVLPSVNEDNKNTSYNNADGKSDAPAAPSMGSGFYATEESESFFDHEALTSENSVSDSEWWCPTMEAPTAGFSSSGTMEAFPTEDFTKPNVVQIPDTAGGEAVNFDGYTLTITEDFSKCTLTNGEQEYIYICRMTHDLPLVVNSDNVPYDILTNTTDGKIYYVALAYDILIVRDENYKLVKLFE